MKKTLKVAVAASILATPAMAANMENPLYLPSQGEIYSKTSAGVMYKKTDKTDALVAKDHDGANEFPIWRIHEDIGYGITDRLAVHGSFGYTKTGDIDRKGLHLGRIGMTYRILEDLGNSVWDIYADAHMGGVSEMKGSYGANGFTYDNYSNGRWGFHVGTRMGHTWGKLTGMMFAEVLQTFGNNNNKIDITGMGFPAMFGMPDEISVDLRSTTEFNGGIKTMYELNDRWSFGSSFTFKHHANNGVKSLHTKLPASAASLQPTIDGFIDMLTNMEDGFDEYIIGASVANQLSEHTQVVLYGEYTMDTAQRLSQNGSDIKAEVGVRLNVAF
jgi:opacity protein-like surface antigen